MKSLLFFSVLMFFAINSFAFASDLDTADKIDRTRYTWYCWAKDSNSIKKEGVGSTKERAITNAIMICMGASEDPESCEIYTCSAEED